MNLFFSVPFSMGMSNTLKDKRYSEQLKIISMEMVPFIEIVFFFGKISPTNYFNGAQISTRNIQCIVEWSFFNHVLVSY